MTNRFRVLLVSLLLTAGCAEMRWVKPGADEDAIDNQFRECLALSRWERGGVPAYYAVPLPRFVFSPLGGATVQAPLASVEAVLLERERTDRCMREKGYRLLPAEAAAGRGRE